MKASLAAIALATFSLNASVAICTATAAEKKLAGAAKESFMKRCSADAKTSCEAQAKEKKLAGAAQTSFVKKFISDATGS